MKYKDYTAPHKFQPDRPNIIVRIGYFLMNALFIAGGLLIILWAYMMYLGY